MGIHRASATCWCVCAHSCGKLGCLQLPCIRPWDRKHARFTERLGFGRWPRGPRGGTQRLHVYRTTQNHRSCRPWRPFWGWKFSLSNNRKKGGAETRSIRGAEANTSCVGIVGSGSLHGGRSAPPESAFQQCDQIIMVIFFRMLIPTNVAAGF